MRSIFFSLFCFIIISSTTYAEKKNSFFQDTIQNPEEALFLRRVIEFWEENEVEIVKKEITNYLNMTKESAFRDYLLVLLGDIYMQEENYNDALENYKNVEETSLQSSIKINILQCLYQLQRYTELVQKANLFFQNKLSKEEEIDVTFYLADSLFHIAKLEEEKDKQKELAFESKDYFQKLLTTKYDDYSNKIIVQIYVILEEYKVASDKYISLAKSDEDEEEEHLLQAAYLQTFYDKNIAIQTYEQIYSLQKNKAQEAAYNRLILLFETQRYEKIISEKEEIQMSLPREKRSFLPLFIGRSAFHLNDYELAVKAFTQFLNLEEGKNEETKCAITSLIECGRILEDKKLLAHSLHQFEIYFPNDEMIPQGLFAKAILEKQIDNFDIALQDLLEIEKKFPSFENKDEVILELAQLFYQQKKYSESRDRFFQLIKESDVYGNDETCWRQWISSSIQATINGDNKAKELLVEDLTLFLQQDKIISEQELRSYQFMLMQCQFNLKQYHYIIESMPAWIENNPTSLNINDGYYMLAIAHQHFNRLKEFFDYSQKALQSTNGSFDHRALHLTLFNTYIELSSNDDENKDENISLACNHLFQAQRINIKGIKRENLLWLVDNYYWKIKEYFEKNRNKKIIENVDLDICAKKSIEVLEKILFFESERLFIDDNHLYLEPEVIKLAEIYHAIGDSESERNLLVDLVEQYRLSPSFSWKYIEQALFQLGQSYEEDKRFSKAIESYDKVLSSPRNTYIQALASLHRIKLRISQLDEKDLSLDNREVADDINHLKNLCIRKKIENEPMHLEAALEYVDLMCLVEKENKSEKRVALLTKVYNAFLNEDDILSQDYHYLRKKTPEKDKIFQAYTTLMQAEIIIAKILAQQITKQEYNQYKQGAWHLLDSIKERNLVLNIFIRDRIKNDYRLLKTM